MDNVQLKVLSDFRNVHHILYHDLKTAIPIASIPIHLTYALKESKEAK